MVTPHPTFEVVTPDTVAECWDGVYGFGNLYEQLWACVSRYDNAHRANIEDMGPHDVIGLNSVAEFWKDFSPENQTKLNELAEAQELEARAWRRNADRIDGYDRDDIGESPDY